MSGSEGYNTHVHTETEIYTNKSYEGEQEQSQPSFLK